MRKRSRTLLHVSLISCCRGSQLLSAQEPARISDNSFLIEEAYNQEAGVVQHISTLRLLEGREWSFSFTQEWPVKGQRHQLSYTIPVEHFGGPAGSDTKIGDIALNYRFQAVNQPDGIAVSPRLSVLLPTGNEITGAGGVGFQVNLPVSVLVSSRLVTHYNAGFTITPRAENGAGERATTTDFNLGASAIYLLSPTLNLMVEAIYVRSSEVLTEGDTFSFDNTFVSPGLRYAINTRRGLQIVPGIAYTIDLGPNDGGNGLFLYLSFEHPFRNN